MSLIFSSARVEQIIKHALDRHRRQAWQFGITEILRSVTAELYIALQSFGRASMFCVLLKLSIKECAERYATRAVGLGSMLFDRLAQRISRFFLLSKPLLVIWILFPASVRPAKNE
jgi:hypothetical protein